MRVPLHPGAEVTLEANPGTAEAAKFAAFRAAGVNRLSLGVQSFDDASLKLSLGRIHDGAEARRAIDMALAHFERVNLDLMYALPGRPWRRRNADIATAIGAGVTHISAYHLTLEPNTPFHHAPPPLPDDDLAADMQDRVEATLAAAGFRHYETSAFARPPADSALPAQPQLLDLRRLPRHRRRRAWQAVEPREDLARGAPPQSRALSRRRAARRLHQHAPGRRPAPTCPANS
jgi:coproporphyrinogen III oxidase-like Fe-S oxidoreductase